MFSNYLEVGVVGAVTGASGAAAGEDGATTFVVSTILSITDSAAADEYM